MSTTLDLDEISSEALFHLAAIKADRERREAEERVARLAGLHDAPALGFYRRGVRNVTPAPPEPPAGYRWNGWALLEPAGSP